MKTFEEITTSVVETVSSLSYKKLNCDYFSKSIVVYTSSSEISCFIFRNIMLQVDVHTFLMPSFVIFMSKSIYMYTRKRVCAVTIIFVTF